MYASTILSTYKGFSPCDVYKFHCEKGGVKEISGVVNALPGTPEDFGSVKELDFSLTYFGDSGCYSVLETVRALHGLEVLRLTGVGITNAIVKMLAQIAVAHPSLQVLDVGGNEFLSAPAGELLLEMAKKAPGILRVGIRGTNIPSDLERKLRRQVQGNIKAFLTTSGTQAVRSFLFEAALSEVLSDGERALLCRPMRTERLDQYLGEERTPAMELTTAVWLLPTLTPAQRNVAVSAFKQHDENGAGVVGYLQMVECMKTFGFTDVDPADAFLNHVFTRLNTAEDGYLGLADWLVLLQNYLLREAVQHHGNHLRQLRMAYDLVGTGRDTTALHASACVSNLMNITGRNLPDSIEDKVQAILVSSSGLPTTDESLIPMTFEDFAAAEVVAECLLHRGLRDSVVHRRLYVGGGPASSPH
eukprot:Rhum_TRINITY_DN2597_c0_g1::Rhum_TRINITY_DN2597_c0_g1_i1::g.7652::m.7652